MYQMAIGYTKMAIAYTNAHKINIPNGHRIHQMDIEKTRLP
jgi:hypothetical protein